jgi:hypothetical protein
VRLEEATEGLVVRNRRNGSFYRYVRPEGTRVRIRPLELFPNGLLIEKTADTIVDADLQVDPVTEWSDEVYVEVDPKTAATRRAQCEAEFAQKQEELVILEAEMITAHERPGGRGSHANRIKACRWRVEVLERGLAERTQAISSVSRTDTISHPHFDPGEIVQLPSGNPARLDGYTDSLADVRTRVAGSLTSVSVPVEVLRPWHNHSLATR